MNRSYLEKTGTGQPGENHGNVPVLLEVVDLKKYFHVASGLFTRSRATVKAVDGVSLSVIRGETLGLVGESGCGKSTLGRVIARLDTPTDGRIIFDGMNVTDIDGNELRNFRKRVQLIFQDPYSSLNPRMSAGAIVGEALGIHNLATGKERKRRVTELLTTVGLTEEQADRYPHEFSGGQRQRIGIARALSVNPDLIIADEPVSALDVSIQAQILNLLKRLQREFGLTYIFISHDLGVVGHVSDRIAVMYLGKIVELGEKSQILQSPRHPYARALLSAVPVPDPRSKKTRIPLPGDIPSPFAPPPGCAFHPRCPYRMDICSTRTPELTQCEDGHFASCHLSGSDLPEVQVERLR